MNFPLDQNINKFFKGFQTTPQGKYEDPSYLGFRLVFDFNPTFRNLETGETDSPLFSEKDDLESAIRYLKATGYPNRAQMLQSFKTNLNYVNSQTPWYWQTLTGLNDLWKIESGNDFNPFRAKDKFLEITCLESIDLRITALADLYRKATFDSKFMRMLVPENLTWFTVRVQLAEMRNFTKIKTALTLPGTGGAGGTGTGANQNAINADLTAGISNSLKDVAGFSTIENIDNLISIMEFQLGHCVFDFWDSFPTDGPVNMNGDMSPAKQKFKIKIGRILEQNTYTLLDLVLGDGVNQETKPFKQSISGDLGKAFNNRPDNILTNTVNGIGGQLQDRLNQIAGVPANLVARGVNAASAAVTGVVLGNVYSIQNQSVAGIVNGFVGQHQQIVPPVFEDVYSGVPGPDITTASTPSTEDVYTGNTPPAPASGNLGNIL